MAPAKPPVSDLPPGHPSLPANPYGQQPQQTNPQLMQYMHMQMAMQQQLMQSQAYAYGAYFNPQAMMRQSLFQPVSYQPVQNEQGYTYSSSYLEQQQKEQQQQPNQIASTSSASALPPTAGISQAEPTPRPVKKPRLQNAPANPNVTSGGAWRNCVQEGCAFVGPEKDVALHEQDRHLIYKNRQVERSEEEEAALAKAGPAPPIPGTSIRLETEEDIAKWIAQRRARWPTAARVEEREKERQDKIARGEIDPNAGGRGRRGRGGRTGTRGGRGRGGSEAAAPARTRDAGYSQRGKQPEKVQADDVKSHDETSSDSSSDDSSDSDSEADVDTKASPLPKEKQEPDVVSPSPSSRTDKPICKFFAKTGKCRHGNRCHFLHERQRPQPKPLRTQPGPAFTLAISVSRPSLLAALLENPINQTLSNISQALQFLVENDFLDGVELTPGEYDDAVAHDVAGKRPLVQIMNTDIESSENSGRLFDDRVTGPETDVVKAPPEEGSENVALDNAESGEVGHSALQT